MPSAYDTSADLMGGASDFYNDLMGTSGQDLGNQMAGMLPDSVTQEGVTAGSYGPDNIGQSIMGSMNDYIDPYYNQVLDAALGKMSDAHAVNVNNIGANAESAGAFGGARHALLESEANSNYGENVGNLTNQVKSQAFGQALNQANNVTGMEMGRGQYLTGLQAQLDQSKNSFDANAALSLGMATPGIFGQGWQLGTGAATTGAQGVANMGQNYYSIGNDITNQQAQQGAMQQQLLQAILSGGDASYQQYMQNPYQAMDLMSALLNSDPRNNNITSTGTQSYTPGMLDYASLAAGVGASAASGGMFNKAPAAT